MAEIMDEYLENIFSQMLKQGSTLEAIDFLKSIDTDVIPSVDLLRKIIFEILMKSSDIRSLALSSDYLVTILSIFPPNNEQMRDHYYHSIRNTQGHLSDLWSVFSHIVNSYFCHHSIYDIESESNTEVIKYPNCKFLLEFYVKLFSVDLEYLYAKSYKPCLVMKLLWNNRDIVLCQQTDSLLRWINDIYKDYYQLNKMGDLLVCMHEMLTLMIKCFLNQRDLINLPEVVAFKHPSLSLVVEATINLCKNSFDKPEKVKLFLASLSSLKYFQAKMSQSILKRVLRQASLKTNELTLKGIIVQYMFRQKSNKFKNKSNVNKEKNLRKRLPEKEKKTNVSSSDKKCEGTKLHELIKEKKFGDLFEAVLNDPMNINTRDNSGCTPLHLACQTQSFICAQLLIQQSKKDAFPDLDFAAMNLDGDTALHLAVKANSVEIVKEILSTGGPELLNIRDNTGYKPSDWCTSKDMESLLQSYQPESSSSDHNPACESFVLVDKDAPKFKLFNDYSIYLHALTFLISSYCELFNVYEFTWKKIDVVNDHARKQCCHFSEDLCVCSEDAQVIAQMPNLIEELIESLQKEASSKDYNIDIELIPLKVLMSSLKPS